MTGWHAYRRCPRLLAGFGLFACTMVPATVAAQDEPCRFVCSLTWKFEPTFTIENLANQHRIERPDGTVTRATRDRVFESVLALDIGTRVARLGFTAEMIAAPFADDNAVQLEFEANIYVLTEKNTNGWVTSHVDVVNQFSPSQRPQADRAYGNKLDFEWDTAFHVFNGLRERRWLRGVELETSLDYLATGLPKKGDVFPDGTRYLDDASHWSVSFLVVIPIAPF